MSNRLVQIFESHTKLDKATCDKFDIAAAREGIKVFRSEYESIDPPAWETIKRQMKRSVALFLLVGPELVKSQEQAVAKDWKFTQNWIAYEVGLACALGKDVWATCDGVEINFPVPYLNNYSLFDIQTNKFKFARSVFRHYLDGKRYRLGFMKRNLSCPYEKCGAKFNLHAVRRKGEKVRCPTCLQEIIFHDGWLLPTK